jgi:hypothetical protein
MLRRFPALELAIPEGMREALESQLRLFWIFV